MRSRSRLELQRHPPDFTLGLDRVAATLRHALAKLERNWPLSVGLMLLAIALLTNL